MVVLIPPIAVAGGVGWSLSWRRLLQAVKSARARRESRGAVTAGSAILAAFSLSFGLLAIAVLQAVSQVRSVLSTAPDTADLKAAQLVVQLTTPDAVILTDAQGIAFAADRDVPLQLTDTSFVRIASGYLTTAEVIRAAEQSDVQLFLLWSGRLALLPGLPEWAEQRFPYHVSLGKGRELYSMRPALVSN